MTPAEIQKLLGGYATGTLTEAEERALFEAALHDQALFDALAAEQPLRDLLDDPAARAQLLAALEPAPRRFWTWRPAAAVLAMAAIATFAVVIARRPRPVLVSQAVPAPGPVASTGLPQAVPAPGPVASTRLPAPEPAPTPLASRRRASVPAPRVEAPPAEVVKLEAAVAQAKAESEARAAAASAAPAPAAAPGVPPVTTRTSMFASENQAPAGAVRSIAVPVRVRELSAPRALRYSVLRRDASGAFVEAALAELTPEDTVELRFTAGGPGTLTVGDNPPVVLAAAGTYTTPPVSGRPRELKVTFSPARSEPPGQAVVFTIKLP